MGISETMVARVAGLANLELSDDELASYTEQLSQILEYVKLLDRLDTAEVEPTSHSMALRCPLRADRPAPSMAREALLDQAPAHDGELLLVPKVLGS